MYVTCCKRSFGRTYSVGVAISQLSTTASKRSFVHFSLAQHGSCSSSLFQLRVFCVASSSPKKQIIFIRHGLTEMNERLQIMPWYSENFEDGALYDTRLSETGVMQAKELHRTLQTPGNHSVDLSKIKVVLASPLTRTLQTAELAFSFERDLLPGVPRVSHPLLRERLYLSSEVGRSRKELKSEYPHWDFSAVPIDRPWWYVYNRKTGTSAYTMDGSVQLTSAEDENLLNNGSHEHDRLRRYITEMQTAAMDKFAASEEITAPQPVSFYDSYATAETSTATDDEVNAENMRELNSKLYLSNAERINNKQGPSNSGSDSDVTSSSIYNDNSSSTDINDSRSDGDSAPYVEWRPAGKYCCEGEPNSVFTARIKVLRQWLLDRPESHIAVVTHWGVLKALTGREFGNCEVQVVCSDDLLSVPDVVDE